MRDLGLLKPVWLAHDRTATGSNTGKPIDVPKSEGAILILTARAVGTLAAFTAQLQTRQFDRKSEEYVGGWTSIGPSFDVAVDGPGARIEIPAEELRSRVRINHDVDGTADFSALLLVRPKYQSGEAIEANATDDFDDQEQTELLVGDTVLREAVTGTVVVGTPLVGAGFMQSDHARAFPSEVAAVAKYTIGAPVLAWRIEHSDDDGDQDPYATTGIESFAGPFKEFPAVRADNIQYLDARNFTVKAWTRVVVEATGTPLDAAEVAVILAEVSGD